MIGDGSGTGINTAVVTFPDKAIVPREATKPPEVIAFKLPGRNEMPDGDVEGVVAGSVIPSARALPEAEANAAPSKTIAIAHVRFNGPDSPFLKHLRQLLR